MEEHDMNTFSIEKLPDESIICFQTLDGWEWKRDMPLVVPKAVKILDAEAAPVFWISDLSKETMSLDDAIWGANFLAKHPEWYRHENIIEVLMITPNPLINLASRGLTSASFGNMPVQVFDNFDAALAYVHAVESTDK